MKERRYNHYFKDVRHLDYIDVYRVSRLWNINDDALFHALKKILNNGQRGTKSSIQDIKEAIVSLERFIELEEEDARPQTE